MTSKERFQSQFDKCFRRPVHKVLTGIEKEQAARDEAKKFWAELTAKRGQS